MIGKNNPFNIRYDGKSSWIGLTGETKGFCNFSLRDYGIRAVCVLVMRSYRMKNVLTISEIINRFAPSSENDTQKYLDYVCNVMNAFPFDIPTRAEFPSLLSAMSVFEGNPVSVDEIKSTIKFFKIVPYKCKN